jgi:hypothetical protein
MQRERNASLGVSFQAANEGSIAVIGVSLPCPACGEQLTAGTQAHGDFMRCTQRMECATSFLKQAMSFQSQARSLLTSSNLGHRLPYGRSKGW